MKSTISIEVSEAQVETTPEVPVPRAPGLAANRGDGRRTRASVVDFDFEEIASEARTMATQLGEMFRPALDGPSACEVKFGIKISATGKLFVASASGEVALEVKLSWTRHKT